MFQVLKLCLCVDLAGTRWKTHVQKYLCHFSPSERDWDHCRRDALHIQRKTDRLLPFTILPLSLPSGSCRRMLSIAKQGKSYQRRPEPRMKTKCKPKTPNIFSGKFAEIYFSNVFKDYVLGLVATNTHFFHWSALITFWTRKPF